MLITLVTEEGLHILNLLVGNFSQEGGRTWELWTSEESPDVHHLLHHARLLEDHQDQGWQEQPSR